jgi:hypothetical protein
MRIGLTSTKRDGDAPSAPNYEQKILEERLAQLVRERQAFLRDVKLGAIVLGVLLILVLDYISLVAADYTIEGTLSKQADALVRVEGYMTQMSNVVSEGTEDWEAEARRLRESALKTTLKLDASSEAPLAMLKTCAEEVPATKSPVSQPPDPPALWPQIVELCIIEPMGAAIDRAPIPASTQFAERQSELKAAIALAQQVFPLTPTPTPSPAPVATATPIPARLLTLTGLTVQVIVPDAPTPTPTPTEVPVHHTLDAIDEEISKVAAFVQIVPDVVISPAPSTWWMEYAGEHGTLRSFRDNLFLAYANPFGEEQASLRAPSLESPRISWEAPTGGLAATLAHVRDNQERLQTKIDERTSELQQAVPDFARPVLAVAKPRYLVHLYPLLVTVVALYLLLNFVNIRRETRRLIAEFSTAHVSSPVLQTGVPNLPWTLYVGIAAAAVALLGYLAGRYDLPQFDDIGRGILGSLPRQLPSWSHQQYIVALALLIALATPLLAVIGSKSEDDWHEGIKALVRGRNAATVTPPTGATGASVDLEIQGRDFRMPRALRLVRGDQQIPATDILASPTRITGKVVLDQPPGGENWDVVVEHEDGTEVRLAKAFAITA